MNEQIESAVNKLVEMGWIALNENVVPQAISLVIREHIAKASYRDVVEFFNQP